MIIPIRTPFLDERGNLTVPWIRFFDALMSAADSGGRFIHEEPKLTADTEITVSQTAAANQLLTVFVVQGASPGYSITLDPAKFAPHPNLEISATEDDVAVLQFAGRDDRLWWPASSMVGIR